MAKIAALKNPVLKAARPQSEGRADSANEDWACVGTPGKLEKAKTQGKVKTQDLKEPGRLSSVGANEREIAPDDFVDATKAGVPKISADDIRSLKGGQGQGTSLLAFRCSGGQAGPTPETAITERDLSAYEARNAKLVGKTPTLDIVLKDPDAFVADVKGRFATQKAITPQDPYAFDFGDYGLPVLGTMEAQLGEELTKVQGQLEKLEQGGKAPFLPGALTGRNAAIADRKLGLEHLTALKQEIGEHLGGGEISYRRTQELGYFVARALGQFDLGDLNLRDRAFLVIDRHLQGYEPTTIQQEVEHYKNNEFTVFQKESPVAGFKLVAKQFDEAFFNQSEMELISLPTAESLGPGAFMRLCSYDVFLMGVSPEPAAADGFVRPGGDFWLHDVRHSSSIFGKRKMYEAEHQMTQPQTRKLQKQIDVWRAELDDARREVPSKELRYAIGFFSFNYHHDRGLPMVPSSYLPEKIDDVAGLLHMMLRWSDQPRGFDNPKETLQEAYAWLRDFWLARMPEEQKIQGKDSLDGFRSLRVS